MAVERVLPVASTGAQQASLCCAARLQQTLPVLCRCMSVPALAVTEQLLGATMEPSSMTLTSLP